MKHLSAGNINDVFLACCKKNGVKIGNPEKLPNLSSFVRAYHRLNKKKLNLDMFSKFSSYKIQDFLNFLIQSKKKIIKNEFAKHVTFTEKQWKMFKETNESYFKNVNLI